MCRNHDIERLYCGKSVRGLDLRTVTEDQLDENIANLERLLKARRMEVLTRKLKQENEACATR